MKKIFSFVMALFAAVSLYASDLNIYASGLKATQVDTMVTVEYVLNTQATALELMIYTGDISEAMVKPLTDPTLMTKGYHRFTLALPQDVPAAAYHWAIKAMADTTHLVDALNGGGMYNYYLPQDVAVDNNFDSPFFGRVYVSEPYDGAGDGMTVATQTQTRGIYMYNADMTFVNGDTMSVTGYDGGMGGNRSARNAIKRIAIDEAGLVYIASRDDATKGIWRMDPANPTAPFVQVLASSDGVDAIAIAGDYVYTIQGVGMGTGTMNRYANADVMSAPISMGQDSIIHFASSDCDAAPDGRGGFWMAQNRWNKDGYPCLVHVNTMGACDYKIDVDNNADLLTQGHNASYRGVVTVSADGSMVAMGSDKSAVVFSVEYDLTTAVPTLTRIYATTQLGSNIDGVAFDVADNLYVLSASTERLYCFPIPKTVNEFVTPAPANSKVYIGVPVPVQDLYLMGDNVGWNPTQGTPLTRVSDQVFEGVFTFTKDTSYFAFFDALAENNDQGGWDYVNAHRYAGAEDNHLLNKAVLTDTIAKANHSFMVAPAGQYKLRVDLNTNKVKMFYQAPAVIEDNAIFIAFKDIPGKEDSDNSSAVSSIADIIEAGAEYIDSIPVATKIYNAREGCGVKFGTGSAAGELKIRLANAVIPDAIIINAVSYNASEGAAVLMGDTVDLKDAGNKVLAPYTKTYDGRTIVSELTFATTAKRMYLLDVIIIPHSGEVPTGYRIKHPWDVNNIDPWIWQNCEEQADGTWALEDRYYGGGCNIDPKVLEQDWIASPVLVGNPYNGDSCRFVINPNATDVAGILTITKLGEPNPEDTTVVYEHLYEIGANQGWNPNAGVEMTKKADNVFEGTFTFTGASEGYDYFGFITELNESWDVVNQHRFGPASDGVLVEVGDTEIHENKGQGYSFKIAGGTYVFTVNINEMKLTVSPVSGIRNIDANTNVQKVLRNGQIYIIRDGETYTITGAKLD